VVWGAVENHRKYALGAKVIYIDGQIRLARLQTDNFVCFFINKRAKDKLPFAWWANGKNRLRIIAWASVFCLNLMSPCFHVPCLHVSGILQMENGTNAKRQLPYVCCEQKMEIANFRLFAANGNGKRKFVLLGRPTINGNGTAVSANVPSHGYFRLLTASPSWRVFLSLWQGNFRLPKIFTQERKQKIMEKKILYLQKLNLDFVQYCSAGIGIVALHHEEMWHWVIALQHFACLIGDFAWMSVSRVHSCRIYCT
jgi:hypothetical protein